jgi:hypothetical protein
MINAELKCRPITVGAFARLIFWPFSNGHAPRFAIKANALNWGVLPSCIAGLSYRFVINANFFCDCAVGFLRMSRHSIGRSLPSWHIGHTTIAGGLSAFAAALASQENMRINADDFCGGFH